METIIKETFNRCHGLQDALKNGLKKQDKLLLEGAITSLVTQSGIRRQWIEDNLKQIIEL